MRGRKGLLLGGPICHHPGQFRNFGNPPPVRLHLGLDLVNHVRHDLIISTHMIGIRLPCLAEQLSLANWLDGETNLTSGAGSPHRQARNPFWRKKIAEFSTASPTVSQKILDNLYNDVLI
jgi:hypothetical protein